MLVTGNVADTNGTLFDLWVLTQFISLFLFILMCQPCKLLEIFMVQIVCLTLSLLLAANKKKTKSKQLKAVSFCKIQTNGYIALARVLPKRFDFSGNTAGFCPKFWEWQNNKVTLTCNYYPSFCHNKGIPNSHMWLKVSDISPSVLNVISISSYLPLLATKPSPKATGSVKPGPYISHHHTSQTLTV